MQKFKRCDYIQLGASSAGVQTHKFLGKELDRMYGLDWFDLGARRYDAAVISSYRRRIEQRQEYLCIYERQRRQLYSKR